MTKMKIVFITFLLSLSLSFNVLADPSSPEVPVNMNTDTARLSFEIASTLFAVYQFNFHNQIMFINTLRYCGLDSRAGKVADSFPDLPSYYLNKNSQLLFHDIVYKEALKSGLDLENDDDLRSLEKQSLISGQIYFSGYLKGYQLAMEKLIDKKLMAPLCEAAIDKVDKYFKEE